MISSVLEDSDTFQAIIEEGELRGMRKILLQLGRVRFGAPTPVHEAAVAAIVDRERLTRMCVRLLPVDGWQELLATS